MGHTDLNFPTQLILIGVVLVVWAAFLMKSVIFFRLESAGIRPSYPGSWNVGQCRTLERFRLLIGLALVPLWAIYLFVVPSMPTNWPFGFLEAISLISMLSVSYAWALLLAARDWKRLDAFPRSFLMIIAFLVIWWGFAFTAIAWMFAEASAPQPFLLYSTSAYAEREMPRLIQTAGYFFPNSSIAK
jgi:hypothetical protein